MEWDKLINFGVPFVLLAGIAWFASAKVWPFITSRIEKTDAERKEQQDQFITALAEIKTNLRANTDATITTLQEVRRQTLDREKEQSRAQSRPQRGSRE